MPDRSHAALRTIAPGLAAVLAVFGFLLGPASAKPKFHADFVKTYELTKTRLDSCNVCHTDGGGSPRNKYGIDWQKHGADEAAFRKIEKLDSDGDGVSNLDEIKARTFPGDPKDTPEPDQPST